MPSTTSGVTWLTSTPAGTSKDHADRRRFALFVLIWSSSAYRRLCRSRLWLPQSVRPPAEIVGGVPWRDVVPCPASAATPPAQSAVSVPKAANFVIARPVLVIVCPREICLSNYAISCTCDASRRLCSLWVELIVCRGSREIAAVFLYVSCVFYLSLCRWRLNPRLRLVRPGERLISRDFGITARLRR